MTGIRANTKTGIVAFFFTLSKEDQSLLSYTKGEVVGRAGAATVHHGICTEVGRGRLCP